MDGIFDHRIPQTQRMLFLLLVISIVGSIVAAFVLNTLPLIGFPIVLLIIYIGIVDFKKLYYLLYATIPISVAIEVGGGFSTDLPSEPLMIGLSVVGLLHLLTNRVTGFNAFVKHPITIVLLLHLGWTIVATINSDFRLIGFKFLLAKIWYLIPFFFLTGMLCKTRNDIYTIFKWTLIPLTLIIIITIIRHGLTQFSFVSVNFVMGPWFINHVMYAATIVSLFPFLCLLLFFSDPKPIHTFPKLMFLIKLGLVGLFVIAIFLSYTRAAMLALFIGAGVYFIIRWKLVLHSLVISLIVLSSGLIYLTNNNEYLSYAPEYTKAISHERFGNLVEATSQLEDVSTMERVFRWIAGARMIQDRPVVGYGPGSFYSAYKPYTISGFKTYVSHNFDKSGIHCYFLMIFVEQGIPGGIIFLIFSMMLLLYGERIYHQSRDIHDKAIVMATTISLVIINALILINDLLETDKIGSFYFTLAAILIIMDNLTIKKSKTFKSSNT